MSHSLSWGRANAIPDLSLTWEGKMQAIPHMWSPWGPSCAWGWGWELFVLPLWLLGAYQVAFQHSSWDMNQPATPPQSSPADPGLFLRMALSALFQEGLVWTHSQGTVSDSWEDWCLCVAARLAIRPNAWLNDFTPAAVDRTTCGDAVHTD